MCACRIDRLVRTIYVDTVKRHMLLTAQAFNRVVVARPSYGGPRVCDAPNATPAADAAPSTAPDVDDYVPSADAPRFIANVDKEQAHLAKLLEACAAAKCRVADIVTALREANNKLEHLAGGGRRR